MTSPHPLPLNPAQRDAVEHPGGALLVLAGVLYLFSYVLGRAALTRTRTVGEPGTRVIGEVAEPV